MKQNRSMHPAQFGTPHAMLWGMDATQTGSKTMTTKTHTKEKRRNIIKTADALYSCMRSLRAQIGHPRNINKSNSGHRVSKKMAKTLVKAGFASYIIAGGQKVYAQRANVDAWATKQAGRKTPCAVSAVGVRVTHKGIRWIIDNPSPLF